MTDKLKPCPLCGGEANPHSFEPDVCCNNQSCHLRVVRMSAACWQSLPRPTDKGTVGEVWVVAWNNHSNINVEVYAVEADAEARADVIAGAMRRPVIRRVPIHGAPRPSESVGEVALVLRENLARHIWEKRGGTVSNRKYIKVSGKMLRKWAEKAEIFAERLEHTQESGECERCGKVLTGETWTWCDDCYHDYIPNEIREALAQRDAAEARVRELEAERDEAREYLKQTASELDGAALPSPPQRVSTKAGDMTLGEYATMGGEQLPPCPKCGRGAVWLPVNGPQIEHVCGTPPSHTKRYTRDDWLRHVAENTPCRVCGELPGIDALKRNGCCDGRWYDPAEWYARNKPEEDGDDGPARYSAKVDALAGDSKPGDTRGGTAAVASLVTPGALESRIAALEARLDAADKRLAKLDAIRRLCEDDDVTSG